MKPVVYEINVPLGAEEFIELLKASTLAERRPVDDVECMQTMVENANLVVSARAEGELVGVARSVTDFAYCCYLSDIAVAKNFQNQGIGKALIRLTQQQLGEHCKLILLSAPAAIDYYPTLGFKKHPQAWLLEDELK